MWWKMIDPPLWQTRSMDLPSNWPWRTLLHERPFTHEGNYLVFYIDGSETSFIFIQWTSFICLWCMTITKWHSTDISYWMYHGLWCAVISVCQWYFPYFCTMFWCIKTCDVTDACIYVHMYIPYDVSFCVWNCMVFFVTLQGLHN